MCLPKDHSPVFKAEIALKIIRAEKSIEQIAEEYTLSPSLLAQWAGILESRAGELFDDEIQQGAGDTGNRLKAETELQRSNERLANSLREKEILLEEIHHRVKNNLAVITSLLSLQAEYVADDFSRDKFMQSIGRIRSMALIHEMLYQFESFSRIDFGNYLNRLTDHFSEGYNCPETEIETLIEAGNIMLDVKSAIPCGMIVNELITNAYKHAFKGREKGHIEITVSQTGNHCVLTVADDGIGMPPGFTPDNPDSLGYTLIHELTDQLGGELIRNQRQAGGTSFTLRFNTEHTEQD